MPINHAIWTVDTNPQPLPITRLPSEAFLEDMIMRRPEILSGEWMLIGRQEHTGFGGRIDLLAIAPDASLVLIELKRDRTPREVVAQALDYAAWVDTLTADRIAQIYARYSKGGELAHSRCRGVSGTQRRSGHGGVLRARGVAGCGARQRGGI